MAAKRTLYVCRPLLNGAALHKWAAEQGFKTALPADDLHVTVAFSRDKLDWPEKIGGKLSVSGGRRLLGKFGDAVVLRFASASLQKRWQALCDAGASFDFPSYKPHITITYEPGAVKLDKAEPYRGPLEFGPEWFDEVNEDAVDDITETKLMAKLNAAARNALPAGKFALPAEKKYPIPDRSHAANAKARASQMHKRGSISDKQLARINAKADRVLGK